ncbi:zinc ribbon domain-containing protein [Methanoregula sp.]|uniref:double zinc ribbon domain-containing protein n=1 Tax=Methanoregula sp. TaxID=2052170 RepID=UPI003562C723
MTRKCGKCGIPAPDDEAVFCNRCGSGIIDEPEPGFPVCPSCGKVVSDELAEFCNRCGSRIPKELVCPGCGNPAVENESQFCTRCGTPFSPDTEPVVIPVRKKAAHVKESTISVVVSPRKPPAPKLPKQEPVPEWDPFTDDGHPGNLPDDLPVMPAHSSQKKYAHLPLVADELAKPARHSDQQITVAGSSKKYAHLPLIAEELKYKNSPPPEYDDPGIPEPSGKGRKPPQKKGMLGLFKK